AQASEEVCRYLNISGYHGRGTPVGDDWNHSLSHELQRAQRLHILQSDVHGGDAHAGQPAQRAQRLVDAFAGGAKIEVEHARLVDRVVVAAFGCPVLAEHALLAAALRRWEELARVGVARDQAWPVALAAS